MALTFGTPEYWRLPQARGKAICSIKITFDSSYPTGGEAVAVSDIDGLQGDIDYLWCVGDGAGYVFEWDNTNSKIIVYWVDTTTDGAPLAQVVNTTDLSAVAPYFVIVGN
jgi:hypothetical protein